MVKLGIIGCGGMGRHHAGIFSQMADVEVVSVCDIVEDKAAKLADKLGCSGETDFRRTIDCCDAIVISTVPACRLEIIQVAAQAGKDIFCEKPIALTLAEADEIISVLERSAVKFLLGYVLRFTQPYRLMREALASGELGGLVNCWTRRYMAMDPRKTWHNFQAESGGVALDFGSHDIDWLMWMGGPVKTVFAQAARVREGVQSDEHAQVLLAFSQGGMGSCDVSWIDTVSESSVGVIGTKGGLAVDRSGAVRKKLAGSSEELLDIQAGMDVDPEGKLGTKQADGSIKQTSQNGETIQEHFIRCINENIVPAISARQGRDVLEVVLAINESTHTGKAVTLGAD